jgi:drug/metabolite transporter (DMT)-like permease
MTESATGRTAWGARRVQAGALAMVALSTLAIAAVPSLAWLAYEGGSNTLTVSAIRSLATVAFAALAMAALGRPFAIARAPRLLGLGSGVCYAVMLYGFLGAVAFIPVNTTILIYYLHPPLVGLTAAWLGDEAIPARLLAALAVAFVGLGLAIGFSPQALNLPGLALAALATVTTVVVILGNGRAMRDADALSVIFYMMLGATLTLALPLLVTGDLALPRTVPGWLGLAGVAVGYTIGTVFFFLAFPLIGAVRATMVSNLEPLLGVLFAIALLGERITAVQWLGIALVLAAIVVAELRPGRTPGEVR